MPEFKWNELDFLEFFPVAHIRDDYYVTFYNYEAERNGLRLLFTVWEMESVIQASLFRLTSERALSTWAAYVRGEVRLIDDDCGRYLEFEDCIVAPNRFWYIEAGDVFDKSRFPFSVTITVAIDPDFHIAFVNYVSRT